MARDPESKLSAPPDFKGPIENRGCTDVLFTILLLIAWVGMTFIGVFAISNGDLTILNHPTDYMGNHCGINHNGTDMTDYPYLYYVNVKLGGVCVKECPDFKEIFNGTDNANKTIDIYTMVTFNGVYQYNDGRQSILPADKIQVPNYSESEWVKTCDDAKCYGYPASPVNAFLSVGVARGLGFALFAMDTENYANRCLPTKKSLDELASLSVADDSLDYLKSSVIGNSMTDVWTARQWIFGFGFPVAFVISLVYMFLLRIPTLLGIMVWGSILLMNVLLYVAGATGVYLAHVWEDTDTEYKTDETILTAKIVGYVVLALGAIFTLVMCYIRKEIQLSLGTVKEASKAITKMVALVLFPILECTGLLIFLIVWMYYTVNLATMGSVEEVTFGNEQSDLKITMRKFVYEDDVKYMFAYNVFCLIWTYQFIIALGQIIVAMSIAKWYFTRDKSTIGNLTVVSSISSSIWYHSGTAAFGGLILTVINIIRFILSRMKKKAKEADNKVAQAVLCCCGCCFWCLESFVKFLNKNAFIQTAIFGTSFCISSKEAFFLILRNAMKLAALSYVSTAVAIVGKLFITGVTTLAAYFLMTEYFISELSSVAGPLIIIALLAYFVADTFLDVFEFGVSTILQCFIADDEMFAEEDAFAGGDLKTLIDDWETEAETNAQRKRKS